MKRFFATAVLALLMGAGSARAEIAVLANGQILKVTARRRYDMLELVSLINEQLWVGHFDLWSAEDVVMFRHSLLLAGGAEPKPEGP